MDYKKESGRRLKGARTDKKFTLEELSRRVRGVYSASRLGNYEQGIRGLGPEEALVLSGVLGVKASYLLCVDETGEGEMTVQEERMLRDFRALPEKDRNDYARRIEALAMIYREPVPDEKLPEDIKRGARRTATK